MEAKKKFLNLLTRKGKRVPSTLDAYKALYESYENILENGVDKNP